MKNIIKGLTAIGLASVVGSVWAASVPLYQAPDAKSAVTAQVQAGQRLIPIYRSHQHSNWVKVANPSNGKVGWLQISQPKIKYVQKRVKSQSPTVAHAPKAPKVVAKSQPPKLVHVPKAPKAPKAAVAHQSPKVVKAATKPAPQHLPTVVTKVDKVGDKTVSVTEIKPEQCGFIKRIVTTTDKNGPKQYQVIEYSGSDKMSDKQVQQVIRNMERRNMEMQRDMQRMMQDMQQNFFGFQPITPPVVEHIIVVPAQASADDAPKAKAKGATKAMTEKPAKKSFWDKVKNKVSS